MAGQSQHGLLFGPIATPISVTVVPMATTILLIPYTVIGIHEMQYSLVEGWIKDTLLYQC